MACAFPPKIHPKFHLFVINGYIFGVAECLPTSADTPEHGFGDVLRILLSPVNLFLFMAFLAF